MTGVTPRQAQEHVDKGGEVMETASYDGEAFDISHANFAIYKGQDTPRPQWRLVPIPEPTVTIEVPKRWAAKVAEARGLLSALDRTWAEDDEQVREACIKAVQS